MKPIDEQPKNSRAIRKRLREMKEQGESKVPKMRRIRQKLKGRVEVPY